MSLQTTSVSLSWSAPDPTGSYPIIGYDVVGPSGTVFVTGTTYTFQAIEPGTTHSFSVRTVNEFQKSGLTSTLGVTII